MIRKILFNLIIFLVLPVISVLSIKTFTVRADAPAVTSFCFKADRSGVHEATLTVDPNDKPQANSKVYVLVCLLIKPAGGQVCTTGNPTVDAYLSLPAMPASMGYGFEHLYGANGQEIVQTAPYTNQSLMADAARNLVYSNAVTTAPAPMKWQDHSVDTDRQWIGEAVAMPTPTANPVSGMGALQQADVPPIDWTSAAQNCTSINWDPDGRVFDSQSLEPIPGTSVTLTVKRTTGNFTLVTPFDAPGSTLINPYTTLEDGGFSFLVPDGTYHLTPQKTGYVFQSKLTLNTNYSKVYSDIYPALLTGGIDIVEKGGPQHRDIPVDSTGQPTHFPIKFMTYGYKSDKVSSVFVDGRVSHPLATISAYSVVPDPSNPAATIRYRLISTVQANKLGRFSLIINQATFDSSKSEMFGQVEATKADFGASANDPYSAPALLKLNPILTYIQGQATSNGQALPNATVSLVYDGGSKPVYTTSADSQGNFSIPTDYIPTRPYKLRYTFGDVTTSLTTTNFITDNLAEIKSNKINLFYPQYSDPAINNSIKKSIAAYNNQIKNKQNIASSGLGSLSGNGSQGGGGGQAGGSNNPGQASSQPSSSKTLAFVGIILLIIIILTGVGVAGVYFIKKSQNPPTM